ncbi:MAG: NAD(P)-dependent alcohol dehydrogenase [Clostridia bacterium]|nr:NAD(P)-dependent alcohol dehydrogenase [Clostridia bacterium]
MKAAVYHHYGSPEVINVSEVEKPSPKDGEVLIQIKAASVNAYDWHLLRAKPFFTRGLSGLFKPKNKIPGADIAGIITDAGNGTSKFKIGDEVFGCLESCGKSGLAAGGFAEYVCAKESVLAYKSTALSFEEASALPMASVTALQGLRQACAAQGESILINGASGGVGSFAVQIAKALGADVTGVCSTGSVDFVRSLGADTVIDYKKGPVLTVDRQYDIILDVAASLKVKDYRRALKTGGRCIVIGFSTLGHALHYGFARKHDGKTIRLCMANNKDGNALLEINKLVETGQIRAFIDSRYPLTETAEALRHTETGHPKGKIIIIPSY